MKHQERPIVLIKKRKHKGHGGSHGSWKIAYADFMTAMMAFFLVMWLISIASPVQLAQIADYFRTPLAAAITGGNRLTDSTSPIPGSGGDVTKREGEMNQKRSDEQTEIKKSDSGKQIDLERLKKIHRNLDQLIESDPKLLALRPNLRIDMVKEGLRIQIIDSQKRPMFKLGSADVEPYMRDILRAIAPVLNSIPNKLTISGHTDDLPFANGERRYSNWELSADRANASRRELVAGGLDDGKVLRVIGLADTLSLSDRADDPLNRRISLLILNKDAEQKILNSNAEENYPTNKLNTLPGSVPDSQKFTTKPLPKQDPAPVTKDAATPSPQKDAIPSTPAPADHQPAISTQPQPAPETETGAKETSSPVILKQEDSSQQPDNNQPESTAISVNTTSSQSGIASAHTQIESSQSTTR